MGWVLLFAAIGVAGLGVLGWLGLQVWRKTRALLGEVGVMSARVGELADLLAQVEAPYAAAVGSRLDRDSDEAWPGTVETYDDRGADAPADQGDQR